MIGVAFTRKQAPKISAISNTSLHNDQNLKDSLYHHYHLLPTTRIHTNTHTRREVAEKVAFLGNILTECQSSV